MTIILQIQQKASEERLSLLLTTLEEVMRNSSKYCSKTVSGWVCDLSGIDQYLAYELSHHPDFPNHFKQVKYPE
jgi:hypothetical protein